MIIWLCFIFISLVPNFLKIRSTTKQSKKYRSLLFLKVTTQKCLRGAVDLENSPAPGTQAGRALPYSQCWRRARQQRAVLQVRDGWPTPGVSGTGEWELAQGYLDRHLPRVCPWKAVGPSAYQPCFFLADLVSLQWLMVNEFTNSLVQDFSGAFLELSIHTGGQVWRSRARRTFLTGEYGINLSRGHHPIQTWNDKCYLCPCMVKVPNSIPNSYHESILDKGNCRLPPFLRTCSSPPPGLSVHGFLT